MFFALISELVMLTLRCVTMYAVQRTQTLRRIVNQPSLSLSLSISLSLSLLLSLSLSLSLSHFSLTHPLFFIAYFSVRRRTQRNVRKPLHRIVNQPSLSLSLSQSHSLSHSYSLSLTHSLTLFIAYFSFRRRV